MPARLSPSRSFFFSTSSSGNPSPASPLKCASEARQCATNIVCTYFRHIALDVRPVMQPTKEDKGRVIFMNWLLDVAFDDQCMMALNAITEPPRPFLPSAASISHSFTFLTLYSVRLYPTFLFLFRGPVIHHASIRPCSFGLVFMASLFYRARLCYSSRQQLSI